MDETFGKVAADTDLEGTIELVGRMNGPYATHEFTLRVSLCVVVVHRVVSSLIRVLFFFQIAHLIIFIDQYVYFRTHSWDLPTSVLPLRMTPPMLSPLNQAKERFDKRKIPISY